MYGGLGPGQRRPWLGGAVTALLSRGDLVVWRRPQCLAWRSKLPDGDVAMLKRAQGECSSGEAVWSEWNGCRALGGTPSYPMKCFDGDVPRAGDTVKCSA